MEHRINGKQQPEGRISRRWKMLVVLFMLLTITRVQAQTYTLPDTNLRNKLMLSYPSVMTGPKLNITAAGAFTGTLSLTNSNISDASGIQYFTNISKLDLSNNNLTGLPEIPGLTKLNYLYLNYNKLTALPPMTAQVNMTDFQVTGNNLTSLPAGISGMTHLVNLYCGSNNLSSLPDLSALTNLQILDAGPNKNLGALQDLSPLSSLTQLHVHQTNIDTIPGLEHLTKLQWLFCWDNRIRDLSALTSNTTLTLLVAKQNRLTQLPVLTNKPGLYWLEVDSNRLTFEDVLPLTSISGLNIFEYAPQDSIGTNTTFILREKDALTIRAGIDPLLNTNRYNWYRNGVALTTTTQGILDFPSITLADSGVYQVEVTNPAAPKLILESYNWTVKMLPCLDLQDARMSVISTSCKEGTVIDVSSAVLGGGVAPFSYAVKPTFRTDTIHFTSPRFDPISPGIYQFIITDSRGCKAAKEIVVPKAPGCNAAFSPDGDGIMDTYFIEDSGKVKIYDTSRNLIRELNAPAVWDGTRLDGSDAEPGYYAIVINSTKVVHISLIR